MASIQERKRADGSTAWRVKFRINTRMTSETFDDEDSAAEFGALVDNIGGEAALRVRDARDDIERTGPTLASWFEHHLDHSPGITAGTKAEYRRLAKRSWLGVLGSYPIEAVDRDAVARWVDKQAKTLTVRNKPTSAKTIANMHGLLSTVMASAVDAGHRPDNPCRGLRLPRGEREEMVFLSHDDFAKILSNTDEHWRPLLVTLAGTGMRWGEVTALQWSDVDLDADEPAVRITRAWKHGETDRVIGIPKTQRSRRTVSLPPEVVDVMRPLCGDGTKPSDLVFHGPRSGKVYHQSFRRAWHAAVGKANIGTKPRVHDLRHSHVSWLIAAGVPLPIIQRRVGHEKISTTVDVYGHLAADAGRVAAAAASLALAQALPELAN